MNNEYTEIIRQILGKEVFSKLSDTLFNKVNTKFPRIRVDKAIKIVECNIAIILIIGVEKGKGCTDEDIVKRVNWYNVCSQSEFLENNIIDMEKVYDEYIQIIISKVKENKETESNI